MPDRFPLLEYLGLNIPLREYTDKFMRRIKTIPGLLDNFMVPVRAPKIVFHLNRSFTGMLDRFGIKEKGPREIMETFTSFSGVPPGRASAILTSGAMLSAISHSFRPEGYFDEFPAALARLFREMGGELQLNCQVKKTGIQAGKVTGVQIGGTDHPVSAKRVVTTVDPMLAMKTLVGEQHLPASYRAKVNRTVMSQSTFTGSLGPDDGIRLEELDLDYLYNLVSTGLGTSEELYDAFLEGDHGFSGDCFQVGVIAPSLTTGGKTTLTVAAGPLAPGKWKEWREKDYSRYRKEKERFADFLIGIAETYFVPGLSDHIIL